jgi:hypothetical protein
MTLPIHTPIDAVAAFQFAADILHARRFCFSLGQVAPVVGVRPLYLEAACQQLLVEHTAFHNTLGMTPDQVQALLLRLGPDGDLTDNVLAEAYLREQSRPEHLNRHLWAVK